MVTDDRLGGAWWALRIALGVGTFLAGLDKFLGLLATWSMYLAPVAERLLPVSPEAFFRAVGVVEMAIGLAILSRWTRAGAYVLAAWMLATSANLVLARNFWDLVLRDVQLALAAYTLARLTEWRAAAPAASPSRAPAPLEPRAART